MTKFIKSNTVNSIKEDLFKLDKNKNRNRTGRFVISALSSIPWVGGVIAASSNLSAEIEQGKISDLQKLWLEEHSKKIRDLALTISEIVERLEKFSKNNTDRLQSEEYLNLVKKGFKEWDNSETNEKKEYIKRLLINAGVKSITTDDLIRLFIDWIKKYHETHFLVIKQIYKNKGITRKQIWDNINPTQPKENSVEADLYKLLIRDLSMGGIIRQHRETDYNGNFIKTTKRRANSGVYKSAFDDEEQYELTELGNNFVHYTMTDVVNEITE